MLEIQHLKKYFATQKAVDDVSFSIQEGSIFGLLGPNGAGKSSLLRMITGITLPDEGTIRFKGMPFDPLKHSHLIGYMPEERGLYKRMKVAEQALYLARLKGMDLADAKKQINEWFTKLSMQSWANKKVEDLSKGMSQKLQFVITVLHRPQVLILDEPFSGLDPVNSAIIKEEIDLLAKKGTTIIFSTHRMEQVEEICEDIVLINKGRLLLHGAVKEIRNRYRKNRYILQTEGQVVFDGLEALGDDRYLFHDAGAERVHGLLQYCIQKGIRIVSLQEQLPSLNDIFIECVNDDGGAVRSFEKQSHS
ncbi:MAG TPA: ATP-binding cassette domain-containing protein [Chitinophagaceae bacterium]|nr:ATP-binding cassette domain-containing protein [Chitinophagaceae bacterium]HNF70807.1 ATP-binding cassette domain-containing protein [Chitinophagaceae bacterium]